MEGPKFHSTGLLINFVTVVVLKILKVFSISVNDGRYTRDMSTGFPFADSSSPACLDQLSFSPK